MNAVEIHSGHRVQCANLCTGFVNMLKFYFDCERVKSEFRKEFVSDIEKV